MKLEETTVKITTLIGMASLMIAMAVGYSQANERMARIEAEKTSLREANKRQDDELRELRTDIRELIKDIKADIGKINDKLQQKGYK
jgi:predicted nuclease with TOPRIM domain